MKKSAKPAAKPAKAAKPAESRCQAGESGPAKLPSQSRPVKTAKAKPEPELKGKKRPPSRAKAKKPAAPVPPSSRAPRSPPKKPGENETPGDADSPLLDMSDVGVRKMIARAKQRGYVTYDELNKVLPSDKTSSEQIEDTMAMLNEMGINVIESEEAEEGAKATICPPSPKAARRSPPRAKSGEQYDRTDDPVRMYLREMGSVELLSREGEIAIAKRIEAGRELMIGALVRKPADLRGAHRVARRIERRQGSASRHHRSGSHVWRRSRWPARAGAAAGRPRRPAAAMALPRRVPAAARIQEARAAAAAAKPPRRRRPSPSAPKARKAMPAKPRPPPTAPPMAMISTMKAICRSRRWKRR